MVDIVEVGIRADTTQLDTATTRMRRFGAESQRAAGNTGAAQLAMQRTSIAARQLGLSAAQTSAVTRTMAANLNDVAVSLAAGANPFQVAIQQSQILGSSFQQLQGRSRGLRGVVGTLGRSVGALVNPFTLVTLAAIAGGGALVSWGASALRTGRDARTFADALSDARDQLEVLESLTDTSISSISDLTLQYGALGTAIREVSRDLRDLQLEMTRESLTDATRLITEGTSFQFGLLNRVDARRVFGFPSADQIERMSPRLQRDPRFMANEAILDSFLRISEALAEGNLSLEESADHVRRRINLTKRLMEIDGQRSDAEKELLRNDVQVLTAISEAIGLRDREKNLAQQRIDQELERYNILKDELEVGRRSLEFMVRTHDREYARLETLIDTLGIEGEIAQELRAVVHARQAEAEHLLETRLIEEDILATRRETRLEADRLIEAERRRVNAAQDAFRLINETNNAYNRTQNLRADAEAVRREIALGPRGRREFEQRDQYTRLFAEAATENHRLAEVHMAAVAARQEAERAVEVARQRSAAVAGNPQASLLAERSLLSAEHELRIRKEIEQLALVNVQEFNDPESVQRYIALRMELERLAIVAEEFSGTLRGGIVDGLRAAEAELRSVGDVSASVRSAIRSVEDAFIDFALTGRTSFSGLIDSMINDVLRFAWRTQVAGPFADMFGDLANRYAPSLSSLRPEGLRSGGWVGGAGTGTSDSNLALLSRGEYVVNAAAARRHASLLEAINAPGYQDGGPARSPQDASDLDSLFRRLRRLYEMGSISGTAALDILRPELIGFAQDTREGMLAAFGTAGGGTTTAPTTPAGTTDPAATAAASFREGDAPNRATQFRPMTEERRRAILRGDLSIMDRIALAGGSIMSALVPGMSALQFLEASGRPASGGSRAAFFSDPATRIATDVRTPEERYQARVAEETTSRLFGTQVSTGSPIDSFISSVRQMFSGEGGAADRHTATATVPSTPTFGDERDVFGDPGFRSGGRSGDNMFAWLSKGEFVVNAQSARRHGHLLNAINNAPGFQHGGMVGGSRSAAGGGSHFNVKVYDQRQESAGVDEQPIQVSHSRGTDGSEEIEIYVRNSVTSMMDRGDFDGAARRRYGLRPALV